MLTHGGRLLAAARDYGIEPERWLDLSTGINPDGWPVSGIPAAAWQRLPEDEDGLLPAARVYYGCPHLLAVAGSQAAIQMLPHLRRLQSGSARVILTAPAYQEHRYCWQRQGHEVQLVDVAHVERHIDDADVVVLINPNNPTGQCWPAAQLLDWRRRLAARGGWLLLDEAFMDATPEQSLCAQTGAPGLIVLRSLGKFFGLAGARVGFVAAWPQLLQALQEQLGPWALTGPSRHVAAAALRDRQWQQENRRQLQARGRRLGTMLADAGLMPDGGTALFQWLRFDEAIAVHAAFARRGILLRLFSEPLSLRFGLPGDETQWQRLQQALGEVLVEQQLRERRA